MLTEKSLVEPTLQDVFTARRRILPYLSPTPLVYASGLSARIDADVWLKCEYTLPTRAFKVRGGLNLVSAELQAGQLGAPGLTAASTGNHGQSVAYAGKVFGIPVTIFVPVGSNPSKVKAMETLGATVRLEGQDFDQAREACEAYAAKTGARYVHSMNEPLLIAGVGTAYLEALMELPSADGIVVPIGGGSGASAAGLVAKSVNPSIQVIGVQAEGAPAIHESFHRGILARTDAVRTAAEGLATRVAFPFPVQMIRRYVDDVVLVSDDAMREAQAFLFHDLRTIPEMAGAAATAALLQTADKWRGKHVVVSISGANPGPQELQAVWARLGATS